MSVFGGMSKGERNRIKIRVRTAMSSQAQLQGRYLGGRPPYGYRIADAGTHPNPAKAAAGQRLHKLEPDPATARVVLRIFTMYVDGMSDEAIALRLNHDGIPCPSAHDAARNPHRTKKAWQAGAVRAILHNPRYTGHEVWNKQRKEERLLDIDDVTLGHRTTMTHNPSDEWIWSNETRTRAAHHQGTHSRPPSGPAGSAPASTSGRNAPTGEAAGGPTSCEDG
ncbi:hypothetical protein GCM10009535_33680 [Streptomyces thermocarboxydovorans]|uniref:Recombinase domain-containing protein n=1 Tax=Streptomyces thermocarboxydovorans TaxID=59298 RepID=A0ABP3SMR2_9ACTN